MDWIVVALWVALAAAFLFAFYETRLSKRRK